MRGRSLVITIAAAAATIGLAAPQLASSAPNQDPRAQREQVRAERAQVASQIDTSKASLAEIDAALQTLEENLRTQQGALARTEAQVAQAKQDVTAAEAAIAKLTEEVAVLKDEIRRRAVQAYVSPPGDDVLSVLEANDFTTASTRKFYIELRAQKDADITDRLNGAASDLAYQKRKATEAKALAEQKQAEQKKRTQAVAAAEAEQQNLSNRLESTIDSQVARSIQLAKTDRALSAKIAQQQAALVARLAAQRAANDKASKEALTAEQQRIRSASAANVGASGKETAPAASRSGGGAASVTPGPVESGVRLAYVQGIPVNAQVGQQVTAMINAAGADGVNLRIGNSYRSVSNQIELRKQNCGTSYYAIYEMSSGSCSPPTAKPGQSQHQLGLAIDFASCSSRGSACYQWLAGNASQYGYYNLPSEPWHWSTTGS